MYSLTGRRVIPHHSFAPQCSIAKICLNYSHQLYHPGVSNFTQVLVESLGCIIMKRLLRERTAELPG